MAITHPLDKRNENLKRKKKVKGCNESSVYIEVVMIRNLVINEQGPKLMTRIGFGALIK